MRRATPLLLLILTTCAGGPAPGLKQDLAGGDIPVHEFRCGHLSVAVASDAEAAARVRRYLDTLLARLGPGFGPPSGPVQVFVFDTRDRLGRHVRAICREDRDFKPSMGFYHRPTRSVLCSLQWGLGWLGDIVVRSFLADDWKDAAPARWFEPGFVSMLYNSFRTAQGDFCGFNVMSYYRPQVQRFIAEGRVLPLRRVFRGEWDEALFADDTIRKHGREFLAWLFSRGQLMDFYKAYRDSCTADPSGIRAVEEVLGQPLDPVERDWLAWMTAADGEIGDSEMAKPFPVLGILIARGPGDGAGIFHVCAGSPAERAGLLAGERILAIGERAVAGREDLIAILGGQNIGAVVTLTILRDGRKVALPVTLDRFIDG